jgi:hypothetical protein
VQPINARRRFAGQCGRPLLVARAPRGFGVARDGNLLDVRQMLREPAPTLRQRLRMGTHSLDFLEVLHASHQMLVNAQLDFTANLQRRRQEHVERVDVHRAFARVLDRRDTEVRRAALDLVKDLVDGGDR